MESDDMTRILPWAGQIVIYAMFGGLIGYFSSQPSYNYFPADQALIKLSFAHGAQRKEECRKRTREELEKLAPNMRKPMLCSRERLPVYVELSLDGKRIYAASLSPAGLSGDGPARVYARLPVPTGRHQLSARLRDTARATGFDYERTESFDLKPGHSLAIDFRADIGGFVFE
jgi:hypothetical protein